MNKKAQFLPGMDEFNPMAAVLAVAGALGTFWYIGKFYDVGLGMQIFSSLMMLPIGYFTAAFIFER